MILHEWPWLSQPQDAQPRRDRGLIWLHGSNRQLDSARTSIRNEIDGTVAVSSFGETAGAALLPLPSRHGVALRAALPGDGFGVEYMTPSSWPAFRGLQQLTILSWFVFLGAPVTTGQTLRFRLDNQMTLDVFGRTANSITWGSDWAGAWNGSSQQTLGNLTDGQMVCIGASIRQNGARFFANGVFSGTKAGSGFTITTTASQVRIMRAQNHPDLGLAAFGRALSDEEMIEATRNPWGACWEPVRVWVPTSAAPAGAPTLSDLRAVSITSSSVQATYDYTF